MARLCVVNDYITQSVAWIEMRKWRTSISVRNAGHPHVRCAGSSPKKGRASLRGPAWLEGSDRAAAHEDPLTFDLHVPCRLID